jgi:hypothetical protein
MRVFLEEMSWLRDTVGERRTMVVGFPNVFPGMVSFMAGLNPAPHFVAREMIVPNMLGESLAYLKAHIGDYDCMVSDDLKDRETAAFLAAYPQASVVKRSIGGDPYYVILRP